MGIAGSVGGIIRGHLVFTDVMNRPHLASELARTKAREAVHRRADGAAADGRRAAADRSPRPLTAVLTIALATGIALAAVLMEPATTAALLGE